MKKRVTTMAVVAVAAFSSLAMSGCGEPELKTSEITIEAGAELEMTAEDYFNTDEENYDKISFDTSAVDTAVPGEYEVIATYNEKTEYTINVTVEDTIAPQVTFEDEHRYVFTNDVTNINTDFITVKDKTECTVEFTGFERIENPIEEMTDEKLKTLEGNIVVPGDQDELAGITDMDVTEEGVYRGIFKVTDLGENVDYEEVVVIYDTTSPLFAEIEDETIEQEDVTAEPELDESKYTATDNFDGDVETSVSMELTNEENHQYTVTVTATDRAGNTGTAEYIVNVVEKSEEVASTSTNGSSSDSSSSSSSSTSGSSSSSSGSSSETSSSLDKSDSYYANLAAEWGVNTVHYDADGCFTLVASSSDFEYGNSLVMNYLNSMGLTGVNGGCSGYWYRDTGYYMCIVPASEIVTIESTQPDVSEWENVTPEFEVIEDTTPAEEVTP